LTEKEEQTILIFERKIIRVIYGPCYETGMEKQDESRNIRDGKRRKHSKMYKRARDKLVKSPGENRGG